MNKKDKDCLKGMAVLGVLTVIVGAILWTGMHELCALIVYWSLN